VSPFTIVWVDVGLTGQGGRYRLGHWPVGLDDPLWQRGVEFGSMYSQAYVSVDGVGDRSASIALCDWVPLKRRAREAEGR